MDVQKFIEEIKGMTVLELSELVKAIEEEFGVSAAATAVAAGPVAAGEFNVVLASIGERKMDVIKAVKTITGLGLKEAKELVDNAPKTVKENVSKADADSIKEQLEAAGATVELK